MKASIWRHPARERKTRAFTLIEILVVTAIISILAGIAIVVGVAVKRNAAEKRTKTTLQQLDLALSEYLKGGSTFVLLRAPSPSAAADDMCYRGMFSYEPSASILKNLPVDKSTGTPHVVDGYGTPIIFIPQTVLSKPWYFLSAGVDGRIGTSDDIASPGATAQ